jgi:hypothetical protein
VLAAKCTIWAVEKRDLVGKLRNVCTPLDYWFGARLASLRAPEKALQPLSTTPVAPVTFTFLDFQVTRFQDGRDGVADA